MKVAGILSCILVFAVTVRAISPLGIPTTEPFNNTLTLDPKGNYVLYWNYNDTHVTFEVHVKTKGYVGFGISPNGNMYPGDVVVGWVKNGQVYFKDRHTTAKATPMIDSSQDWHLLHGEENDFGTLLKFVRKIDTCDSEDIKINDATQRLIYSYHPDDPQDEDSLMYHGAGRRGTKSVSLLRSNRAPEVFEKEEIKIVDITAGNYIIPSKDTTYTCIGFQMPDIGGKHHMVMFESVFTPGNEQYLHHFAVQRCNGPHPELHMKRGECLEKVKPDGFPDCPEFFAGWAVGGGPFYFPKEAGYSVGAPDDLSFYMIQIHYNNPDMKSGVIDNSGIRLHLTPQLRQHDLGSAVLGTNPNQLIVIPPGEPGYIHSGYCPEFCLNKAFAKANLKETKFIAALQHAHYLGAGMKTRHFRNGTELKPLMDDPNYDFYFQEYRSIEPAVVVKPIEIKTLVPNGILIVSRTHRYFYLQEYRSFEPAVVVKPGDSFITECTYDSSKRTNTSYGGFATVEEMCETMVYHYPKLPLIACQSYPAMEGWYGAGRVDTLPKINQYRKDVDSFFDWNDPVSRANFTQMMDDIQYIHICAGPDPATGQIWGEYKIFPEGDQPYTPYVPPKSTCT